MSSSNVVQRFRIAPGTELRLESGHHPCTVTLTDGSAEVFGALLHAHRALRLKHAKIAIFSYEGCTVSVDGLPLESPYVSEETPMNAYLNASHVINNQRQLAREIKPGPVVAVVGPPSCGKTTLVKVLANYAIRAGWNPLLVDTSVQQNLITVPGALAAAQVEVPIEADEGVLTDAPLIFCYGHTEVMHNSDVYLAQIDRLAQLCKARETEYEGRYQNLASGTIIDTPACQSGQERDVVKHICQAFAADIILVIGEDKLHSFLDSAFKGNDDMQVVKVPKSGGTVTISREQARIIRDQQVYQYFYGLDSELQPHLQYFSLAKVKIYKVPANATSRRGLLPTGKEGIVDGSRLTKVEASPDMVSHLMGVSYTDNLTEVVRTNVAGFVWVQQIDFEDNSIALMCPHVTPPPTFALILSAVKRNLELADY